ncbi:MAG: transcriptional regulator [Phycisphaerales bacterium]|jgi:HTH-type transcriptional regulator / antitoxin HigA|nr:transcriptional regulator [Phycisphaerales bacterium]
MKSLTLTHDDIPSSYAELVDLLMPRPLHDDVDYRNALGVLDAMAGFEMNVDQEDYFEAIATFVEKYEFAHHAIASEKLTPVELLRSLIDAHGMSESDLGRLLGDRSLGHRVLSGERDLSKAHIRTLAEHFSLNPAVFL